MAAHNSLVERTYKLEGQMTEVQHDIRDLKAERGVKPWILVLRAWRLSR